MVNKKTSKKQKKFATKSLKEHVPFKSSTLKNKKLVIDTLLECIRKDDVDSFKELLTAHLMTVNKVDLAKKSGLSRRALYDLIDPKKKFNPGLSTITKIIKAIAA